MKPTSDISRALFFSGGGARGAYQVGVTLALFDILKSPENLFNIFSGYSAGAINASFMAQHANKQKHAAKKLARFWNTISFNDIYRTDTASLSRNSIRWISDLSFGSMKKQKSAESLLDSSPLLDVLNSKFRPHWVQKQIDQGYLKALCCHSFNYNKDKSMVFLHGEKSIKKWDYEKRAAEKVIMTAEHIFASCSIPIVFPSVIINNEVHADGAVRNTAPLSAAIHSGADKLFIIGVDNTRPSPKSFQPTIGAIISTMLKALFFDALDADVTRLKYLNQSNVDKTKGIFKAIPYVYIKPSIEVKDLSKNYFSNFPRAIRFLLEGLGSEDEVADLASYLLFDSGFTSDLIQLGKEDAHKQKDEILEFFAK